MKEKWLKFLKENGFLLFLFICVGVVAFSTVYVVTQEIDTKGGELLTKEQMKDLPEKFNEKEKAKNNLKPQTPKNELAKVEIPKENLVLEGDKANKDKKEDKPTGEESEKQVKEKAEETKVAVQKEPEKQVKTEEKTKDTANEEAQATFSQASSLADEKQKDSSTSSSKFLMPVDGNLITQFTSDTLVYSKTLDEWRAHPGVDLAAKIGEKVKAPLDGEVKEINKDPLWGTIVVLDHGNGLITKFANLGDTNMIKKGLKVKRGDHIAVVGKTADIEMLMESHLHFEVIKNGKLVDPRSIP